MLDGGVNAAAAAAAAAARRAAEAARRAAEEAARRAAEAARQRAEAAKAAQQAAQAKQAQDALKAQGAETLAKGVEAAKNMGELKFEGDKPTSAPPNEAAEQPSNVAAEKPPVEEKPADAPFETGSTEDLSIGGGRTRTSSGSTDGSIGGGETGITTAGKGPEVEVEEEASTTDLSEAEQARQERFEGMGTDPRAEQQMIREHARRTELLTSAIEAMPPEQQQQFQEIRERVRATEDETQVQSADFELEQMAMSGDLTAEVTRELHRMATQPMSPTLTDKDPQAQNRILAETIRQISNPTAVKQDPKYESCGLNALEQEMVRENPAGYVKFMADMVSRDVRAHLPGDPNINDPTPYSGVPINTNQIELPLSSDRSLTSTLFQQGIRAAYATEGEMAEDPISPEQFNQILNEMSPGKNRELVGVSPDQSQAAMDEMKPPTIVVIATVEGSGQANSHAVTVTAMTNDPETDKPMVTFNDPYGQSITVPAEEFQKEMRGMVVDTDRTNIEGSGDAGGEMGGGRVRFTPSSSDGMLMGGGRSRFSSSSGGEL